MCQSLSQLAIDNSTTTGESESNAGCFSSGKNLITKGTKKFGTLLDSSKKLYGYQKEQTSFTLY